MIRTTDLLKKLYAVLDWGESVRPRVDAAFDISDVAYLHHEPAARALERKAKLLAAHEFRGFDSLRRGVNEELHLDISFMILYSMINEFFSWLVNESDKSGRKGEIRLPSGSSLSLYEPWGGDKDLVCLTESASKKSPALKDKKWPELTETVFFDVALMWLGLREEATQFDEMKKVRNK